MTGQAHAISGGPTSKFTLQIQEEEPDWNFLECENQLGRTRCGNSQHFLESHYPKSDKRFTYHPDALTLDGILIEIKRGQGYNQYTLSKVSAAAKKWGRKYKVVCDIGFKRLYDYWYGIQQDAGLNPAMPIFDVRKVRC